MTLIDVLFKNKPLSERFLKTNVQGQTRRVARGGQTRRVARITGVIIVLLFRHLRRALCSVGKALTQRLQALLRVVLSSAFSLTQLNLSSGPALLN